MLHHGESPEKPHYNMATSHFLTNLPRTSPFMKGDRRRGGGGEEIVNLVITMSNLLKLQSSGKIALLKI